MSARYRDAEHAQIKPSYTFLAQVIGSWFIVIPHRCIEVLSSDVGSAMADEQGIDCIIRPPRHSTTDAANNDEPMVRPQPPRRRRRILPAIKSEGLPIAVLLRSGVDPDPYPLQVCVDAFSTNIPPDGEETIGSQLFAVAMVKWIFYRESPYAHAEGFRFGRNPNVGVIDYELMAWATFQTPVPCTEAEAKLGYRRLTSNSVCQPGGKSLQSVLDEWGHALTCVWTINRCICRPLLYGWNVLQSVAISSCKEGPGLFADYRPTKRELAAIRKMVKSTDPSVDAPPNPSSSSYDPPPACKDTGRESIEPAHLFRYICHTANLRDLRYQHLTLREGLAAVLNSEEEATQIMAGVADEIPSRANMLRARTRLDAACAI